MTVTVTDTAINQIALSLTTAGMRSIIFFSPVQTTAHRGL